MTILRQLVQNPVRQTPTKTVTVGPFREFLTPEKQANSAKFRMFDPNGGW
jgi:hypothetical protein